VRIRRVTEGGDVKRRALEKYLQEHNCVLDHHGGNHDVWTNLTNHFQAPIPRPTEIQWDHCAENRSPTGGARSDGPFLIVVGRFSDGRGIVLETLDQLA
jgi:hypothetical protein